MLSNSDRHTLVKLVEADGSTLEELIVIAGLDPARAFRGADLRGVDFGSIDLAGYDFSGADLTGASLERASIAGAVFTSATVDEVRWPTRKRRRLEMDFLLRPHQQEAVDRMIRDLDYRGRAIALMPAGTGRSGVLETVIAYELDRGSRGILLVRTAAERDQFIRRLKDRLGPNIVSSVQDVKGRKGVQLLVINSSSRSLRIGTSSEDGSEKRIPFDVRKKK